jgi:hypothetical protein
MVTKQRRWTGRVVCLVAVAWCGFVLLAHWTIAGLACASDTSDCAKSRGKNGVYTGVLRDDHGRPLRNRSFSVAFASRRGLDPVSGFHTDAKGRYCIVWASERIVPFVSVDDGSSAPRGIDGDWRPLAGARPPAGCEAGDAGIPWPRADDATTSWQFRTVPAVVAVAVGLLLVALLRGGARVRRTGLALTLAGTLLAIAVRFL